MGRHGPGTGRDLEAIESSRTCTDSCTLSLHLISQIFDSLFRDRLPASYVAIAVTCSAPCNSDPGGRGIRDAHFFSPRVFSLSGRTAKVPAVAGVPNSSCPGHAFGSDRIGHEKRPL